MNSASTFMQESTASCGDGAVAIVFVVFGDILVRGSLELLIQSAGWQAETFASMEEFRARRRVITPSCLVVDVTLPDLNGLDLEKRIGPDGVDMPIIFITGNADVPTTARAMKAGAAEFLTRPVDDDVLLRAIHDAVDRSERALRQQAELRLLRSHDASLTAREREVMDLVVTGKLNKQIGGALGISEITVKAHRGKMMRKMKAGSLVELVNMVARLRPLAAANAGHASHATPIVFVVDGNVAVRKSMELLIRSAGWEPEVFASAQEFLSCPRVVAPNCLVLDVTLPDLSGLDLQQLVADRIEMPIIFSTANGDVRTTVRAIKAGAVEFLTKPVRNEVLLSAMRHAIERSRAVLGCEAEIQPLRERYRLLSRREREVMALVASGRSNRQVGRELGISEITVQVHRGRMMRKMRADSLASLVNMVARLQSKVVAVSVDDQRMRVSELC